MAIQLQRISLPVGPGSLRQLSQSATHVLRMDTSETTLLIDLSGKKPVAHVMPSLTLPGKGSEPDTGLSAISGVFSANGEQVVLLREGTEQKGGRKPRVEFVKRPARQDVMAATQILE